MKKNNNRGFVLVETLIVTTAVCAIFTMIFKHFYPLMGEYERRQHYDDVDSKYGTYWIKRMIQDPEYNFNPSSLGSNGYINFSCNNLSNPIKRNMCYEALVSMEVSCDNIGTTDRIETCENKSLQPHIYITNFILYDKNNASYKFKTMIKNNNAFNQSFRDYVESLPNYNKVTSLNGANYRVVVEYYRHGFDNDAISAGVYKTEDSDVLSYSQIEVKK